MPTLAEDSAELQRLTETLLRILNKRDFEYKSSDGRELLNHVASDFEARFDTYPDPISFKEQTEIWKQNALDWPELQFSVLELNTQIRRRSATATVYLKLSLTGMNDVQVQGSCQLNWRKTEEGWMLHNHITMRGLL